MGSIVTHVEQGSLGVKDHDGTMTRYETWNVLWTAGVEAPPLAGAITPPPARGRTSGRPVVVDGPFHRGPSGDLGHRGRDEPGQAARGGRGRHADRVVRRAQVGHLARGQDFGKPFKYRDLTGAYISRGRRDPLTGKVKEQLAHTQ